MGKGGRAFALVLIILGEAVRLAVAAAPAPATTPAKPSTGSLTFYHWLVSPAEAAALKALVGVFSTQFPTVTVTPTVSPSRESVDIFPMIRNRMLAKSPPDAFLVHPGYALKPFVDGELVGSVDHIWISEGLSKVMPAALQGMNRLDGRYYSVPLAVHRDNVVWYNKALLQKYKVDPESLKTWDSFFDATAKLRGAGISAPIQMSQAWTTSLVFEGAMASVGISAYEDWVNGKIRDPEDPRLLKALRVMRQYFLFVNTDHEKVDWTEAMKRVGRGESAFCIMGDWADGELRHAGMSYGREYGTIPVPGTRGMYGVTMDVFAVPRGLADPTSSDRWLRSTVSREGQDAFNSAKGSISARADADVTRYEAYQRAALADLKTAKLMYPTVGAALPEKYKVALDETMNAFANDNDVEKAAKALTGATTEMAARFTRVWSLDE